MKEATPQASEELEKWEGLRERSIPTLETFRVAKARDGKTYAVTKDLSENGRKYVVSENNRAELKSKEYWELVLGMSEEARRRVISEVFTIAVQAGQKDSQGRSIALWGKGKKTHPFSLILDKSDPNDVSARVIDLGIDVSFSEESEEEVVRGNVRAAILFLSATLGVFERIPQDHEAAKYMTAFSEGEWTSFINDAQNFKIILANYGVSEDFLAQLKIV